jgi:hypothetical protein
MLRARTVHVFYSFYRYLVQFRDGLVSVDVVLEEGRITGMSTTHSHRSKSSVYNKKLTPAA